MQLSTLDRLSAAFGSLVDGLCDPQRRRRVALALVCAYAAAWTLYGVIAKSSQDINADMAEMVIWAREPALGYPKHPPLPAFILKLWFAIFPFADWAYLLLAAVTVSAGIYLAIELCGIWLEREKRATVPFLLAAIPFYNFLGLKFDQNSALIPLWALAMWALMRSLESRRVGWAVLMGLAAAAAILVKYWSGLLLAALAFTTLVDRRRDAYWRSPAPWISALVFVLAVLPHVIWLIAEDFPPITWVMTRRLAQSGWDFLHSLAEYVFGTIGYGAVAIILVAILIRPTGAAVRDSWFATRAGAPPGHGAVLDAAWSADRCRARIADQPAVDLEYACLQFAAGHDAGFPARRGIADRGAAPRRDRDGDDARGHRDLAVCRAGKAEGRRREQCGIRAARRGGGRARMARNHRRAAAARRRTIHAGKFGGLLHDRPTVDLRRLFTLFVAVGGCSRASRARALPSFARPRTPSVSTT